VLILAKGLVVGLVIAAPLGPIAMVCISRALVDGRIAGLATGLGAAIADALYGCVAGFGLSAISGPMQAHSVWLRMGGGLMLCLMGLKALIFPPALGSPHAKPRPTGLHSGLLVNVSTTFVLTLSNPVTLLAVAALFAGMGSETLASDYGDAGLLVLGVFTGSGLWWLFLSFSAGWVRAWLNQKTLTRISRIVGLAIMVFGLVVIFSLPVHADATSNAGLISHRTWGKGTAQ
jgi:threonine/homoserine/homoserine lactone efflux protein